MGICKIPYLSGISGLLERTDRILPCNCKSSGRTGIQGQCWEISTVPDSDWPASWFFRRLCRCSVKIPSTNPSKSIIWWMNNRKKRGNWKRKININSQKSLEKFRGFLPYLQRKTVRTENIRIKIRGISGRKSIYWL